MTEYKLVLASASPRRRQLLEGAGFHFDIRLKPVEEHWEEGMAPEHVPEYLARLKAAAFAGDLQANELLITADTRKLSGCKHTVVTGVCLTTVERQKSFSVSTDVYFKDLLEEEISYYVDRYQPFDKAGAYGIQEWIGYIGIQRIEGSFYNVMGLPVQRLYEELKHF